ncbi:MAG: methyltransferase [Chloroflexi bacterium]|nr:methyltransferase [Chloroflexota bacterium]
MVKTSPELYRQKYERIQKAIKLEPADRIPVVYNGMAFAPRYLGMSMADFCADPDAPVNATLDTMDKFGGFDGINAVIAGRTTVTVPELWLSRVKVPGRDLPPDSLWQIHEAEVMTTDDYDFIIDKGWGAFLDYYLPRVVDMEEFKEATGWLKKNFPRCLNDCRERGYVPVSASVTAPPYESFCGGRSMGKFLTDLYRIPDKVQAAMDVVLPEIIGKTVRLARESGVPGVWIGGWRTASSLVSPRLMDRFVWPYVLKIVEALLAADLMPIFHWDQDWTRDLVRLKDLPAKKCLLNPDGMTDMRQFKKLVGDRMAMMGDIPSSMFATGTPEDVFNYVRNLVDLFESRGLILCPGCDAPINTKPENMEAFVAASQKYGALS